MALISPDLPQTVEITPTIRILFWAICTAMPVVAAALVWLGLRLWRFAQKSKEDADESALVKRLAISMYGVIDQDTGEMKIGALRRLSAAEERVDDVFEILGFEDVAVKRRAAAKNLGLQLADIDHPGNTFSGVRARAGHAQSAEDSGNFRLVVLPALPSHPPPMPPVTKAPREEEG